ncbi:MAG: glycosyltransferase [Candidatus Hodarchaeota archaeon]
MANHFVTHSESDKNNASSVYGIEKENISVIPLALFDHHNINTNIISARKKIGLENKFVILSFGLIRDYKGIPYLIKAFNTLPEEIAKESILLIVGEIWESRDAINKVIKTSRYSKKIRLIDRYIPDDEVTTYFSASDVVCLPYLRASQSAVAHTAAAFCKPIIVSSVGGLKESMANYEGTTFVPPGNSDAIASQIVNSFTLWKSGEPVNYSPLKQNWVKTLESYKKIFYQENAS